MLFTFHPVWEFWKVTNPSLLVLTGDERQLWREPQSNEHIALQGSVKAVSKEQFWIQGQI